MADYWNIPDFGRRYNAIRLSKNRQVASYGQYTIESVVSRIETKEPGLLTEKVLKEVLNNVFRNESVKEKIMNLLIEDLTMSKEAFWSNEPPQKAKPLATPKPQLIKQPEIIKPQTAKQNTQPQKPISQQTSQQPTTNSQPKSKKKHLKITSHVPDYSFIFVFSEGKIDIYEDKKEIVDRTKEGVWIPPADLKYGSKLFPRTIEVDVNL
ncbi:MAG: hypothetical protein J6Y02_04870 [Pseudobutyrivibrio sp.]|nr:hypothetical protein [Pseudobutyrivibrio sp.]